ncbi:MAG: glucokinase [Acidobacteriia bacterium]|nr:glucokinase [Terriglobia bacterium]
MILAGDVGGTKANFALFSREGKRLAPLWVKSFSSQAFLNLESLLAELPLDPKKIACACFGVPGPVICGVAKGCNLAWAADAAGLRRALGIPSVYVINDLEAMAYGIAELTADQFLVLNEGQDRGAATAALLAAGTGLGEALLYWDGMRHVAIPCEGGQADFAPRNALEFQLLEYLREKFGHASWERVLSGPGLCNIYSFLRDGGYGEESAWVREQMRERDPASVIAEAGLGKDCALCARALELFVSLYGAEAGNLALRAVAVGGIFIGGGIAAKMASKLAGGGFLEAFLAKGRMAPMLSKVAVRVILEEKTPMLGAARFACQQEGSVLAQAVHAAGG